MYRPTCSQLMVIALLALQLVVSNGKTRAQEYSVQEQIHVGELYVNVDTNQGNSYARVERFVSTKLSPSNREVAPPLAVVDTGGYASPLHLHNYQQQQQQQSQQQQQQAIGNNHEQQVHGAEIYDSQHLAQHQHEQHPHPQQQVHAQQANFIHQAQDQNLPSNQDVQPPPMHQVSQHHHNQQQQRSVPHQNQHPNFQMPQTDRDGDHHNHYPLPHHQEHDQLRQRSHQQQLQFLYEQHNQQIQTHIHQHTKIEYSESTFDGGELSEFYMQNFESSYHIAGVPIQHHASSSCNSIDDSSILIMPNNLDEHTCGANSDHVPTFEQHNNKPSRNSNVESFPLTQQHYHYESSLMTAIRHYWREISGLCLASAVFLNWLFVFVKRKFIASGLSRHIVDVTVGSELQAADRQSNVSMASSPRSNFKENMLNNSAHDSAFEETASPLSLDDVDTSSSEESSTGSRPRSISSSPYTPNLSSSLPSSSFNSSSTYATDYVSRYSSDFDSIQRLGRGGFGIVFEAKNKIDDCHYAVKRICLPLEKEARERVMREVRALAKLDHAGIVRYYNAWLETPPDEWLKQHDAQLGIVHTRDGLSFPSTDGIYDDKNELNPNTNGHICDKFGESGDISISEFFDDKSHLNIKHRANDYKCDYMKENSSSPSLDIVFEGSGSIRLEAENGTESIKEVLKVESGLHLEKVYLYIQMQLCRKDTLKDWLRTNCENRDKTTIFDFFYQIVDAVEYVHSQDLIHRDLKPSNIFFSLDGTLKIGDFGLCRAKTTTCVGSSLDLKEYSGDFSEAVHTEQVGTQLYMSPEQMNGLSYNHKVDIFAMGLILLELLVPFKTQMQRVNVLLKARNNMFSREFKKEHPDEHDLVRLLLDRRPYKRPTATAIKQHELLANAQLSQPVIERIYHRRRTISSNSSSEQCDT